jgi:hypothetical protein
MTIKNSVLNTFKRVGINHTEFDNTNKDTEVYNRFGGGSVKTTQLLSFLVDWVYKVNNQYEGGDTHIRVDDFDRIRYFILEQDKDVYNTCID